MAYLEEFKAQIYNKNFPKFLQLWEEYCTNDQVHVEELIEILTLIKNSELAKSFGKIVETTLPMWQTISDKEDSYKVLKLLIDLETTNSPALSEITLKALKERYGQQPQFSERLRLLGFKPGGSFQGALSNYDLLNHLEKGNLVFHSGGWGTGEIVEISPVRQQITVEFENVSGRKYVTFENAFKTLIPLPKEHFLAMRFSDPDTLEEKARENPVEVIKLLLSQLGPKTAGEIKDEMCELVIPEADWVKWWQTARIKLKKDPIVDSPETTKDPFRLRQKEITDEELLHKAMAKKEGIGEIILSSYNYLRDVSDTKQNDGLKETLKKKLVDLLNDPQLTPSDELQILMILDSNFSHQIKGKTPKEIISKSEEINSLIEPMEIIALKKKALILVRENRKDWENLFFNFLKVINHSNLREYLLNELAQQNPKELEKQLKKLLESPEKSPDFFLWYFQQLMQKDKQEIPFKDKQGQCQFFEAFLILLSRIENKAEYKDLVKKMYNLLSGKRYELVRTIIEDAPIEHVQELLLLSAKCHTLSDQDRNILRSLAAVVHSSLGEGKSSKGKRHDMNVFWATEESIMRVQDQVRNLGTVQIVENAREIEAARALGDLRENSEFKFAKEKRARLLGQLKTLSEQLQKARIITKHDIYEDEVGIGSVVLLQNSKGQKVTYTILGTWEADAEKNILSFQSKLAQAMIGCKKEDLFVFKDEEFKILTIHSYLDAK